MQKQTDGPTDKRDYRVACTRLKKQGRIPEQEEVGCRWEATMMGMSRGSEVDGWEL